ncbi:hypothetical protein NMY3_01872 [Candidatus Nitrosocosmicus oleophilus]|uniref:Uncharacterized protein n=1 Tax=Candidatus Nitrosocosmicus oleophilus TaxID=1353260 RepID=A0A654LXY0_9ARCH|nr:hypothetical protein NMY3_01872 [Candidatus Nitrosocosmicus oleophilus]
MLVLCVLISSNKYLEMVILNIMGLEHLFILSFIEIFKVEDFAFIYRGTARLED